MRILQLHNHHRSKGGAMEVLGHEAALLQNAGHSVEQYTLPATEELRLSSLRAGIKAIWNVDACAHVERAIRTFRPDVVHVHTPFPLMSPAVFRTASRLGIPTVATLHSYRYSCIAATCYRKEAPCEDCVGKRLKLSGLKHRCYHDSLGASAALTTSLALHRAVGTFHQSIDRFLALTEFSKRLLVRDGIPESKISVKPNSVSDPGDLVRCHPPQRYVAFAGRLIDVKGVHTLLDAWSHTDGDVMLKIAGDGLLRRLVEERAASDPSVEYLGWLDEKAVVRLMAGAECVVVPSEWYEGLPLVILKSLSVGTPVLASNLENISLELLRDGAGWSFEVGNECSLAAILNELIAIPGVLPGVRERARSSYLRRYSPAVDLRRLEEIYRDVQVRPVTHGR